jgi:hypothetical protein
MPSSAGQRTRALRGLLGGLPPSFAPLCAPAGPSPFYGSSAAGVGAGVRKPTVQSILASRYGSIASAVTGRTLAG